MKSLNTRSTIPFFGKMILRLIAYACPMIAIYAADTEAASEICCDDSCLPGLDQRFLNYCDMGPIKPSGTYFCPDNTSRILQLISEYNRLAAEGCTSEDCMRRLYEINEEITRLIAEGRNCQETSIPPYQWIDFGQLMTECWQIVVESQNRYRKYCFSRNSQRIDQ